MCAVRGENSMYEHLQKERYGFEDLKEIIAALRSDAGCPWDRVQTHESLKGCMREEAYEVIEAIDELKEDTRGEHLREELGDVLLQVMLHSQIAGEEQYFTVDDVVQEISEKMVRRHPHVFGTISADTPEAALDTWEQAKEKEKGKSGGKTSEMERVAKALPALIRCQKVLKKGDLVTDTSSAVQQLAKDVQRLGETPDKEQIGQLLADVVNLGASLKIQCEDALVGTIERMIAEAGGRK